MYRLELICHHPPHQCRCRHNTATEVNTEDLTANLIKHNPALLKYFGKRTNNQVETKQEQNKALHMPQGHQNGSQEQPYRSIVEEKGLNFIVRNEPKKIENVPKPQSPRSPIHHPQPLLHQPKQPQNNFINTSPNKPAPNKKQSEQQKKLKQHHKDLRNQSRYLSNSAFRKYFDRQCFQNYGHKNITHKADGFVYHNYLKTHNINPHTGQNMPINQQTFYHAMVSASPEKYATQQQQVKLSKTLSQGKVETVRLEEDEQPLEKGKVNLQKVLEDNLKHSKLEQKYKHVKLKQKESNMQSNNQASQVIRDRINPIRSEANLNIYSKATVHTAKRPISEEENVQDKQRKTNIQPISGIRNNQSQIPPQKQTAQQNPTICNHSQNMYESCDCCRNQMKKMILTLSESDPDLAARLLTSAKKAAIYKNYTLNNYDNAAMNPRNFRPNGTLNIYQQ